MSHGIPMIPDLGLQCGHPATTHMAVRISTAVLIFMAEVFGFTVNSIIAGVHEPFVTCSMVVANKRHTTKLQSAMLPLHTVASDTQGARCYSLLSARLAVCVRIKPFWRAPPRGIAACFPQHYHARTSPLVNNIQWLCPNPLSTCIAMKMTLTSTASLCLRPLARKTCH